jgi:hypothetical protein
MVVTLLAGLAALATFALTYFTGGNDAPAVKPRLGNVDLIVHNGDEGESGPPRVEVVLHNAGTGRSIVTRATFHILHVVELTQCFTQGGFPLSGNYDVVLPRDPKAGQTVTVPVHEQLTGDEADRFTLSLAEESETQSGQSLEGGPLHVYVFQLEVSLKHDGSAKFDKLGKILVAVPTIPELEGFFLTKQILSPAGRAQRLKSWGPTFFPMFAACWRENTVKLREILRLPGERAERLTRATAEMVLPPSDLTTGR